MKPTIYIRLLLFLLSLVTAFHLCILIKLIPYDIVWGGRLKTDNQMYRFEIISVLVNLVLISILLIKGSYLKFRLNKKIMNVILWIFFFIFVLNTIGNILANTTFEKLFSVLTFILAILLWNILIKRNDGKPAADN